MISSRLADAADALLVEVGGALEGMLGASPCQQISKAFMALRGSQDL
jgi:hypothetical protein